MHARNRNWGRLAAAVLRSGIATATGHAADGNVPDLVNRKALRVCATPANLPYSNEQLEGFENKIANIIAEELKLPVEYTWFPQAPGMVRKTLAAKRCDVMMQTVQADELTQNTNAYYRTTYAIIYKKNQGLDGVTSIFDEKLKDKRVGIQAGQPAADYVAKAGLMVKAKPYLLQVDTRYFNPMKDMIDDLRKGDIDVAILWGPYAGYYTRGDDSLTVVPMLEEQPGLSKLEYRLTMGVRNGEQDWKRQLNAIIKKRQGDIDKVLLEYRVPLIDEDNKLITAARQ
jgi:quinoprotein dehydrogenase-associated probable ABC transporter substrate-binding protein